MIHKLRKIGWFCVGFFSHQIWGWDGVCLALAIWLAVVFNPEDEV